MKTKSVQLLEAAQAELDAVKSIDEAVADGEYSTEQKADRDSRMAKAQHLFEQGKAAKADEDLTAKVEAFGREIGLPGADDASAKSLKVERRSLGEMVTGSPEFKALIDGYRQSDGTVRIPEKARVQGDPVQMKSLFTGTSDTSGGAFVVAEQTGIIEMLGRRELTIRDVISVRRTGSDTVEYVRQTSHTNNAAPVAEATSSAAPTTGASSGAALTLNAGGGYKPEGAWAFERDSATVKTIAEWVPATKRALADVAQLEGLINDELVADLKETEETEIVSGSGSGEHLAGIVNTSGVQTQAFSTDVFETVRKSLTKVRTVGRARPNAIGLNPAEMEVIDLAQDNEGRYYGAGPFSFGPRTLWGIPTFESEAIPSGTAVVGDWSKAVLWDREQANISFSDSHADFFIRNLVAVLAEERVAFAVTRPTAFVLADMTA